MKSVLSRTRLSIIATALAMFIMIPAEAPRAQQSLGIAAVVNEDVISQYDLQTRINLLIGTTNQENTAENRKRHTAQVLNQLITERLQYQEAARLGVKISEKELERAYGNIARSSKMTPDKLTVYLARIGVDKEVLVDQLHAQIAWGRSVNRLFRSEISIGNDEVDEIISEIETSKGKPEYQVGEIFIQIDRPENAEKHRITANNIIAQIKEGANFSVLARNFSQSATAAVGGDLGWIRQGQLSAELDQAVSAMPDGALSNPVQTLSGFYILLKRESRIGKGLVSKDEQVDLFQVFLPLPLSPSDADIAAAMNTATTLTADATNCVEMAEVGAKTGSALSGRLGKVKITALPPQTRELVEDIEDNTPSRPLRSGEGIVVLMVCEREGKMSIDDMRNDIEINLLNARLDTLARRHLRDLRRTAFLDVRI